MKIIFLLSLCCTVYFAEAALPNDTSFISYTQFKSLNKKKISSQFGTDQESKNIITRYYHNRTKGILWLVPAIILTGAGIYFATVSGKASNGMASSVGVVFSILTFIPGLISFYLFGKHFLFKKKNSKKDLYNQLKAYHV